MKTTWIGMAIGILALSLLAAPVENFTEPPLMSLHPDPGLNVCSGFNGFCQLTTDVAKPMPLAPADCHLQLSTDGKTLRIKAESELGSKGLLARVNPPSGGALVFKDDCYEIIVVPNPEDDTKIYHLFVNGKGAVYSKCRENGTFVPWVPERTVKSDYKGETWKFQLDLPLQQFGIEQLSPGQAIGLRVCRNWRNLDPKYYDGCIQSTWCQMRAAFFSTEKLPRVYLLPDAPAVDFFRVVTKTERKPDPQFRITNTSAIKQTYLAEYRHVLERSQPSSGNLQVSLNPGESKVIPMPIPQVLGDELVSTKLTVFSPDKKTVFYHRAIAWYQGQKGDFFAKKDASAVLVIPRIAFYPSTNKMRIQVNFKAETKLDQLKSAHVEIATAAGQKIGTYPVPKPDEERLSEMLVQLPDLKEYTAAKNPAGTYKMSLITDGLGYAPIVIPFERKIFAWEGNQLGQSKRLVPPFTALQVKDGKVVDVILRSMTMSGTGLFQAIEADGEELLEPGGIVLEATIHGETYLAKSTAFRFVKQDDFEAVVEAGWQAGPVQAKATCMIAYDGVTWYSFQLQPCAEPIENLRLKAAFPERMVPLYHACTDGLRFNNGGAMPKGNGLIWKSGDAARGEIQNDFVPYIWVGKEGPGLSFFADSDKGWVHSANVPSQELYRKNGTIEMIWNFMSNVPANTKVGEIRFGLQATPVKPMPDNWRAMVTWNQTFRNKTIQKYFKERTLFCGGDMGRGTFVNDYEPRLNDYSLWKAAKEIRRTGVIPDGFLDQWVEGYPNKEMRTTYRREVSYFLHVMKQTYQSDARIMLYTNPRGLRIDRAETATFMDEWLREEFNEFRVSNVPLNTGLAYSAVPTETFRDYLIWGYKNLYDAGIIEQLYWDNVFLVSCYAQDGVTQSYRMPDGRIQPSMEIDGMRELIRRAAVFQLERGVQPDNMVHMTNTMLTPTLSFAQQQLDWEDNDGFAPFQERYTKEYIRTLTIGYQSGCLPCVLGKIYGTDDETRFCKRTGAGVTLTHELRWARPDVDVYWNLLEKMFDFGYGTPVVKVFNYWKEDFPVEVKGGDATTSVYLEKGNQAQLLVCSYCNDADFEIGIQGKEIAKALDVETGKEMPVKDGKVQFRLPKYDLIFLDLETTK
jgi:hypothetical protein